MKVSLIIPTFNASGVIKQLLENLASQVPSPHETLVVDSSSFDGTCSLADSMGARTMVVRKKDFDHGGTRTLAGEMAEGDILVFLTQDALPVDEHSIENLVCPLIRDEKVGAVLGRQIPYPGASPFGSHLRLFNYPKTSYRRRLADKGTYGIKTAFLSNSFAAYRKKTLEEIGWFKRNLILGEDTYAGAKMLKSGYEIAYAADAVAYHSHNYTIFQEFKRYFDIGVFHEMERWLLKEFGKVKGEAIKYLKSEMSYLLECHKYHLFPEFILRNSMKFLGHKMGHNYNNLPRKLIRRLSMHKNWWDKQGI